MHINDLSIGMLGANGIVGGGIPHAVGAAFASVYKGRDSVAVPFFGDGATNIGAFHESANLAASAAVAGRLRVREQRLRRIHAPGATHVAEGCRRSGRGLRDAQ